VSKPGATALVSVIVFPLGITHWNENAARQAILAHRGDFIDSRFFDWGSMLRPRCLQAKQA